MSHPRNASIAQVFSLFLFTAVAGSASALTWPGPAPCNGTLEACVDAAPSGSVIEITGNAALSGTANVTDKTLTFRPAVGATPALSATFNVTATAGATSVTIENLDLPGSRVNANVDADGVSLSTFIRGNTMSGQSSDTIRFSGDFHDDVTLVLEVVNNRITQTNNPGQEGSALEVTELGSGSLNLLVSRNVISQQGGDGAAAIGVRNEGEDVDLVAEISLNTISGEDYSAGIRVVMDDPSNSVHRVNILNNLITGQGGSACACFLSAAIAVDALQGTGSLAVLSNTLADNQAGFILGQTTPNDTVGLAGAMVNNIVANNTASGIIIDPNLEANFSSQYDLVFNNGSNSYTPGPSTISADPLFVAPGDYHLQAASPARDSGNNAAVLPGMTSDLDGNPRILGTTIDRGVYESLPAVAAVAVPTVSSIALGALAIMLALVAMSVMRT